MSNTHRLLRVQLLDHSSTPPPRLPAGQLRSPHSITSPVRATQGGTLNTLDAYRNHLGEMAKFGSAMSVLGWGQQTHLPPRRVLARSAVRVMRRRSSSGFSSPTSSGSTQARARYAGSSTAKAGSLGLAARIRPMYEVSARIAALPMQHAPLLRTSEGSVADFRAPRVAVRRRLDLART